MKNILKIFILTLIISQNTWSDGYLTLGPAHSYRLKGIYPQASLFIRENLYGSLSYQSWTGYSVGNQQDTRGNGGQSMNTSQDLTYDFTKSISLSLGVTYYKAIKPKGDEVSDVLTRSALKVQLW